MESIQVIIGWYVEKCELILYSVILDRLKSTKFNDVGFQEPQACVLPRESVNWYVAICGLFKNFEFQHEVFQT